VNGDDALALSENVRELNGFGISFLHTFNLSHSAP
jgi:hypothetical protein